MNVETPKLAVDIIAVKDRQVYLIERKWPPLGYALPGGFVDVGETTADAARREFKEETGMDFIVQGLVGVYDDPKRDPRRHVVSVAYWGTWEGEPQAGDDALAVHLWDMHKPPQMCFDHEKILQDFRNMYYR